VAGTFGIVGDVAEVDVRRSRGVGSVELEVFQNAVGKVM
jgi:hypothetical protein